MSEPPTLKPIPIELTEEWVPNQLLVRQDDVKKILHLIELWGHIYLSGPKGVGKTIISKHILQYFPPENTLYIECGKSLLLSMVGALNTKGHKITPRDDVTTYIAKKLQNPLVTIFDDIHRPFRYKQSLNYLKFIYDQEPDDHIRTILTSTTPYHQFLRYCPDEVMSRFQWKPVSFGFYNAVQLELILRQRAERVFEKIDEGTTAWIGAKIRRLGDPRIGIRILRYCYKLSDHHLTLETIQKSWRKEKQRYWKNDVLEKMAPHTALLFFIIARLVSHPKTKHHKITSNYLYRHYDHICKNKLGIEPLYPARLNYYLNQLEKEKWIERKTKSFGRRGYGSEITLLFDEPEIIVEAGKEIEWETFLQ